MFTSDDALVSTIAGIRAKVKGFTQPMKSLILKTEGPDELLNQLFDEGLFNPQKEAALSEATDLLAAWERAGARPIPIFDERYPQRLRNVHEAPGLIFSSGQVKPEDHAVSVVGSRHASDAALQAAGDVAELLVAAGVSVVSGLARGIDAAAHYAALRAGGRTVAIMGTGIDQTYPQEHTELRQFIESSGQVITQFFPETPIAKHNFPMRNATMSGYGAATIVISAGENSGTKHQAKAAIGHGRALILTPEVANSTSWGREYVERGDAIVAYSPTQAVEYAVDAANKSLAVQELFA